jgi:hypothetical protein
MTRRIPYALMAGFVSRRVGHIIASSTPLTSETAEVALGRDVSVSDLRAVDSAVAELPRILMPQLSCISPQELYVRWALLALNRGRVPYLARASVTGSEVYMFNATSTRLGSLNSDPHAGGIEIACTPDLKDFPITTEPAMPVIQVQASLIGLRREITTFTMFEWSATLEFNATECTNGIPTAYPPLILTGTVAGGAFTIRFGEIRGGRLTIRVRARVDGSEIVGERRDLRIVGTNPLYVQLTQALPSKVFRALVWHESRGRQFLGPANGGASACPLYSADRLGGVGLMQLTRPAPTREQTWNWRANVNGGLALFQLKEQTARAYPAQYRKSADFQELVTAYNADRAARRLSALQITIPDFTTEQIELDALRGYNGWSGGIHEFRAARDATGKLVVDVAADGKTGTARWEQVSAAVRRTDAMAAGVPENRLGDLDYVRHVMQANVPF